MADLPLRIRARRVGLICAQPLSREERCGPVGYFAATNLDPIRHTSELNATAQRTENRNHSSIKRSNPMKNEEIVKAWRSPEFRAGLADKGELTPASPAGEMELTDGYLDAVTGGSLCKGNGSTIIVSSLFNCPAPSPGPRPKPKKPRRPKRPGVIDGGDWE
jgi:mersacidin/lichenicidin family type 2 lantibiotic